MTFGETLKTARIKAGYTQDELADKLAVSRSAIAKWENDRGMPDIANLKALAKALDVSVDYLLDEEGSLDLSVTKKAIDITADGRNIKLYRLKKIKIKEKIIRDEYPEAEIIRLTLTKIKNTKNETIVDLAIGWIALILGGIPLFGTQEIGKTINDLDQQYYLVNEEKKQFFVTITDEQIITRTLPNKISEKKFEIGDRVFQVVGKVE